MIEETVAAPIKKKIELEVEFDTTEKAVEQNRFQVLLELADAVDAWRIFPRAFITTYMVLLYKTAIWFMTLPEPNTAQAGLISVVVGAGAAWFGLYTSTGSGRSVKKLSTNK
jgi:hypothetical protein